MKRAIIFTFLLIATASSKDLYSFQEREELGNASLYCVRSSKVERHVLVNLRQHLITEDEKLKEYLFCFLKSINWQNEDGSLNKDKIQVDLSKNLTLTRAMNHCIDLIGGTGAETAYIFFSCYQEHIPDNFKRSLQDDLL